jgi:hypothetical protein
MNGAWNRRKTIFARSDPLCWHPDSFLDLRRYFVRTNGYDRPLYVLPFDHRRTFQKSMFGISTKIDSQNFSLALPDRTASRGS